MRPITRRGVCVTVLGGCLVILDAVLLIAFCTQTIGCLVALAAHLMLTLAVALPSLRKAAHGGGPGSGRTAVLQLAAWTALLGPFGAIIGMTLFLPLTGAGSVAGSHGMAAPGGEANAMPSRIESLHNALLDVRMRLGGGHAVRPLLDIVIDGTTPEKIGALSLIAKRYVPAFAPALKRALQDTDTSVRVLAATVMAQLHNGHSGMIGALQDAAQAEPTAIAWRKLGEARRAYAASGLLEADRAKREADEGDACLGRADALDRAVQPQRPALEGGSADAIEEAAFHAA
jgi:hypothetical protein